METMLQTIQAHIEHQKLLTVERKRLEEEPLFGFPLYVNHEILIMSKIYDFHDEGIIVLRLSDITDVYADETDVFSEKICKAEGLGVGKEIPDSAQTMLDVLKCLENDVARFITVQCELEEDELYFSIGRIENVSYENVLMETFDRNGEWEKELREIPIERITLIGFDDHYSKMYYKYMV